MKKTVVRQFRRRLIRPSGYGQVGRAVAIVAWRLAVVSPGMIAGRVGSSPGHTGQERRAATKSEAPRAIAPESPAQEQASAEALSLHYRFIERYSVTEDPNHPELLTQYRVGLIETQKTEREKQQGAPDRIQVAHRTIYTERAAEASKTGGIDQCRPTLRQVPDG